MAAQVAQVQQFFDQYKDTLDKSLNDKSKPWTKVFNTIEEKTNIPKVYLFLGKFQFLFLSNVGMGNGNFIYEIVGTKN